jgi:hypothetical protein
VTPQNATLVEESAAAADSLRTQAAMLVQPVEVFKTTPHAAMAGANTPSVHAPAVLTKRPWAKPASRTLAVARAPANAPGKADDGWVLEGGAQVVRHLRPQGQRGDSAAAVRSIWGSSPRHQRGHEPGSARHCRSMS